MTAAATNTPMSIASPMSRLLYAGSRVPSAFRAITHASGTSMMLNGGAAANNSTSGTSGTRALSRLIRGVSSATSAGVGGSACQSASSSSLEAASASASTFAFRSHHTLIAQNTAVATASCVNTSGGRYLLACTVVETPVSLNTVSSSGAPGLSSSPPTDAPSNRHAPMVAIEYPAARISGTTTAPRHTAVLVWLTSGMFTRKPTATTPGTSSPRTERSGFTSRRTRCRSQPVCLRT